MIPPDVAACTAAGLVRRIEPSGHPARFERRVGDNHHHLVCRSCGHTEDVDCAVGARLCLAPGDDRGYVLDEAEVVFWGFVPTCHAAAALPADAAAELPADDDKRNFIHRDQEARQ
ncbi:MAG: Fur family transcriptional regulator [Pseudonocardiales bacterium]